MRNRQIILLVVILALIGAAIWILLPNNPGLFGKPIQLRLGLDLVGGVQALLEADLPADTAVTQESMTTAKKIVENRVNGLGVTEAVVQQAGTRRLVVELPGETDPEKALRTIKQTGLLEFVDFSQLSQSEALALDQTTIQTDFGASGETQATATPSGDNRIFNTVMTGDKLKTVNVVTTQTGEPEVSFELTDEGAKIFKDFTSANVGKILAIVLDKQVISAPRINQAITDGKGVISGNFTIDSANQLALQLRYGSLPIPLKVATSQTVGPTLGKDSLQKSLIAGIIGVCVVILYMALYYRLPGLVADLALLVYALISLAIFKFIPITLTLAGIAGFVLSIGVAVDANILIFERLKEELRAGKPLSQAIDAGWKRAWPSIRDSNISTLITCAILFWFGSTFGASIVKGFSLTLAIGVGVSMFTAIVVSRTFLHLILDQVKFTKHERLFGVQEI
jgi:preprotein translocase subunit SecD